MTIEELEEKGIRVSLNPHKENGKWLWTAGVYIGDNPKAFWVPSLSNCKYDTYREGFDAVINYLSNASKKKKSKS